MKKTRHPKIFIGKIAPHPYDQVISCLAVLEKVAESTDPSQVREALRCIVTELREPD
ncbi:MAG: hypothetical protein PHU25_05610 [Deltaproteobacteria bacterium]|nr:hypothetical protein [Deltaproteobacteria bacterium]